MANDVYTYYTLKGNIPEVFKELKEDMADSEVIELFGIDVDYNRWYISGEQDIELTDNEVSFCVWSAWNPEHELWEKVCRKYDLTLKYFSENEDPLYFAYANWEDDEDTCFRVLFEVEYDDDSEGVLDYRDYGIDEIYYKSELPDLIKILEQCDEDGEKYIVIQANDDAWYDDEYLLDYVYTLDELKHMFLD